MNRQPTPVNALPGVAQRVTYPSLDACVEALAPRGYDVELLQLGPGSGRVSIRTTLGQSLTLQRISIDAPALRRGALNPRTVSFSIWDERRPQEGTWCGSPLGAAGISVFPDEFSASGRHRLQGTVVEADPSRCLDAAALLEIELPTIWRSKAAILPLDQDRLSQLSRDLAVLESGIADPEKELEVLGTLVGSLGRPRQHRPRASQHARALAAARDHLRFCGQEIPTVPELCIAAGVSLRTLEYAFRVHLDMTPVQYLKVYRLNQVRKILLKEQASTVVDAANAWGFWHMGKFAAEYRALYGVNPSSELRV